MILDLEQGKRSVKSLLEILMARKTDLITDVQYLAQTVNYLTFQEYSCQRAALFYKNYLTPVWNEFKSAAQAESATLESIKDSFPLTAYITFKKQESNSDQLVDIFADAKSESKQDLLARAEEYWSEFIVGLFEQVERLAPLEIIREEAQRANYVINVHTQLVFCTPAHLAKIFLKTCSEQAFTFHTLVLLNAQTLTDTDAILASSLCRVKRVILSGPCCSQDRITLAQDQSSRAVLDRLNTLATTVGLRKTPTGA